MELIRWLGRLLGLSGDAPPSAATKTPLRRAGRVSASEVLVRVRALQARGAQWPDIWAELNPRDDPTVQQLLMDLRNDGLQFAPSDGLRRVEQACEELAGIPTADVVVVLQRVLGKGDVLDTFR
jgi:hypothetical protein